MTHGDLTPPNILVDQGRPVGLLETGGYAAADPALDLVSGLVWDHAETNPVMSAWGKRTLDRLQAA